MPATPSHRRFLSTLGVALCAAALGGCATRPAPLSAPHQAAGEVDYRLLAPAGEGRHDMARGQAAAGGKPLDGAMVLPDYPADWLERRLPAITVSALVVVDGTGRPSRIEVDEATLRSQCGDCAAAFATAVAEALQRWRFAPLEVSDWIDGPDEDGDGEPDSVTRGVVEARPYSLRLQFEFSLREGEAVVRRTP